MRNSELMSLIVEMHPISLEDSGPYLTLTAWTQNGMSIRLGVCWKFSNATDRTTDRLTDRATCYNKAVICYHHYRVSRISALIKI